MDEPEKTREDETKRLESPQRWEGGPSTGSGRAEERLHPNPLPEGEGGDRGSGGEAGEEVLDAGGALAEGGAAGLLALDHVLRGAAAERGVGQARFELGQDGLGLLLLLRQPLPLRRHVNDAAEGDGERGLPYDDAEGAVEGQRGFVVPAPAGPTRARARMAGASASMTERRPRGAMSASRRRRGSMRNSARA